MSSTLSIMFKTFIILLMLAGDIAYLFEKFPSLKVYSKSALKWVWVKIKNGVIKIWNKIFKKSV